MSVFTLLCVLAAILRAHWQLRRAARRDPSRFIEAVTVSHRRTAQVLVTLASTLTRFGLTIEPWVGPPLPNPLLVVANHQSLLDIPCLTLALPHHAVRFVAKRELGKGIPYVSLALREGGHALISRTSDFREGVQELHRFAALSRRGVSPAVFPEGTRSRNGRLGRFNAGAFRLILQSTPLPVLSVAIDGAWRTATLAGIVAHLGRARYRIRPLTLYPPPRGKQQIQKVLESIEAEIAAELETWRRSGAGGRKTENPSSRMGLPSHQPPQAMP
jgi:1-acyl-sn-glycerol-3-phosphate acyltransferase